VSKKRRKVEKKQRREKKRRAKRRVYQERTRILHKKLGQYPELEFAEQEGDPEFVALIKKTALEIDLDDPKVCPPPFRYAYKCIASDGIRAYAATVREAVASGLVSANTADVTSHEFNLHFGSVLYNRIPKEVRQQFLPWNDVNIIFTGRSQLFVFSSLLKASGNQGTIYYSRKQPTVTLGPRAWKVGFSRHAIEQVVARLNPNYLQYESSSDVHCFFAKCVYHEPAEIDSKNHPNQPAFSMYDNCDDPTFFAYRVYVDGVFGANGKPPDRSSGAFHYRIGYFPVEFDKGFAKATTFLRPGYSGTPELALLRSSESLTRDQKLFLLKEARENKGREALLDERTEVIKWFHDNGVPQVRQFRHAVFDHAVRLETPPSTATVASRVKSMLKNLMFGRRTS
jgi:hypothetical protein